MIDRHARPVLWGFVNTWRHNWWVVLVGMGSNLGVQLASGKGFHTGQLLAAVGILAVVLCLAGLGCGLVERRVMRGK